MARHRKPTEQLKLHGDYEPAWHGDRRFEPKPDGKPRKPKGMAKYASAHWDAIVPSLVDTGVATAQDQSALEKLCQFHHEYETAKRSATQDRKRLMMMIAAHKEWCNLAARFGLTPSDRARIVGAGKEKHDKAMKHLA